MLLRSLHRSTPVVRAVRIPAAASAQRMTILCRQPAAVMAVGRQSLATNASGGQQKKAGAGAGAAGAGAGGKKSAAAEEKIDVDGGGLGSRLRGVATWAGYLLAGTVVFTIGWNVWQRVTGAGSDDGVSSGDGVTDAFTLFQKSWTIVQHHPTVAARLGNGLHPLFDPSIAPTGGSTRRAARSPYTYRKLEGGRYQVDYAIAGRAGQAYVYTEVVSDGKSAPYFNFIVVDYKNPAVPNTHIIDLRKSDDDTVALPKPKKGTGVMRDA